MTVSEKIARLLEMEAAATPGPWEWRTANDLRTLHDRGEYKYGSLVCDIRDDDDDAAMISDNDAQLVPALRNAARPSLLALQSLIAERRARESVLRVGYEDARKATDAALKELEDAT